MRSGGLKLVHMKQAIDTRQFRDDEMFTGDLPYLSAHDVVVQGQPWKWQVDYCGIGLCVLSFITNGLPPMVTRKDHLYTWAHKPYKYVSLVLQFEPLLPTIFPIAENLILHYGKELWRYYSIILVIYYNHQYYNNNHCKKRLLV